MLRLRARWSQSRSSTRLQHSRGRSWAIISLSVLATTQFTATPSATAEVTQTSPIPLRAAARTGVHTFTDPDAAATDLGFAVALSNDVVLLGASVSTSGDIGDAVLYQRQGNGWGSPIVLQPPSGAGANFGISVAVSDATAVVGAPFSDGGRAGAYIYMRSREGWPTEPTTFLPGPGSADSGSSLSLDGPTLIVGAPYGSNGGSAYIYSEGSIGWPTAPSAELSDPALTSDDLFGTSVAVNGSTIIVGALHTAGASGSAYIYDKGPSGWPKTPTAALPAPASAACFGAAVAVSPGRALVSAACDSASHGRSSNTGNGIPRPLRHSRTHSRPNRTAITTERRWRYPAPPRLSEPGAHPPPATSLAPGPSTSTTTSALTDRRAPCSILTTHARTRLASRSPSSAG